MARISSPAFSLSGSHSAAYFSGKLLTLDGMRGVAATAVVVFHSAPLFGQLAPSAYLAVDLFFVLSGLVIAKSYEGRLLSGGLSFAEFLRLRVIRFYPIYVLGLGLGIMTATAALLMGAADTVTWEHVAVAGGLALLFLPGGTRDLFPLNVPAWSLFFELLVNLLYGVAIRILGNRVLLSIVGISAVLLCAVVSHYGHANMGAKWSHFGAGLARATFSFAVGVSIYRFRPPVQLPAWSIMALVCLILVAPVPATVRVAYDLTCILVVFPTLVAAGANVQPACKSAYAYLGAISYCLYAIHYPLIWMVRGMAEKVGFPAPTAGLMLLSVLFVACGWLDRFYDQPIRRRLGSFKEVATSAP